MLGINYIWIIFGISGFAMVILVNVKGICYTMPRQEMRLVSKAAQSETPRMAVRGVFLG